ncbi:HPP family protein [Capsaspora owczarzaki ATCC 30864]|uniref:HPP family protein n=1 Tax=Capsaspora owczarzaki (strain ATCC 30864) TaxID=595528 RepID=A0A0D2WPW5_CAPO3|nr:HPP family protein [Capsaspora owczarzaki ATCC 30864]KJE92843.1 HPP family protein [Capsaspora owczarzaki ATCC 30864]|eukprot:XP_004363467.1 HPP family protein [Capsaspora owczarzaki ATCC 30864]
MANASANVPPPEVSTPTTSPAQSADPNQPSRSFWGRAAAWTKRYVRRLRGQGSHAHPFPRRPTWRTIYATFIGSFTGIAACAALQYNASFIEDNDLAMLIGSFGATAVLVYAVIDSPLSQPRNVFFGHILSAFIGVCMEKIFGQSPSTLWLSCALAVSLSITAMQLTRTVHPPGGATALIAVTGSQTLRDLGFLYIVIPVGAGVTLMLLIALLINNIFRSYPLFWWRPRKTARVVAVPEPAPGVLPMSNTPVDVLVSTPPAPSSTQQLAAPVAVPGASPAAMPSSSNLYARPASLSASSSSSSSDSTETAELGDITAAEGVQVDETRIDTPL